MKTPKRQTPRSPVRRPARSARAPAAAAAADPARGHVLPAAEVEKALLAGTQVAALETYFGEEAYAELQSLARQAASRGVRGGPRVLVIPGTMGTKLGVLGGGLFGMSDVFWLDPCDIALGNLPRLSLRDGEQAVTAMEPILLFYLRLKLRLRAAGFDAEFWGYDWRHSIADSATRLRAHLAKEPAREVHLVAHSMGGLVARAALKRGAPKVKKLIMLGTPNHGAFAATQAIRGTLASVRKLAALDPLHTAEELCEKAFNTFPSTYSLLPSPERFSKLDLYDATRWPKDGARFDPALLEHARRTQALFGPADERHFLIAGVNQATVTDLDLGAGGFVYTESADGDGTVPLDLARLEGAATWYAEEEHGSLPSNAIVTRAVIDILNTGTTAVLPREWDRTRCAPVLRRTTDAELRAAIPAGKRSSEVSSREFRNLLAPLLSTETHEAATATAGTPGTSPAGALFNAARPLALDQVVVGRRRQKRLEICIAEGDIAEVNARALVLGLFREVAPGGAALAIDQRLDGAIGDFVNRRMFSGNVGELFILPTGRHPLQADLVLFAGLGAFDRFNVEILQLVAENTIRTLIRTNVEDFATVLLGSGTGVEAIDSLRHLLEGFVRAIRDLDTDAGVRRVTFCIRDPGKCREAAAELFRLAGTELFHEIEVSFETRVLPSTLSRQAPSRLAAAGPGGEPVYLIVRQERSTAAGLVLRSSALTAGTKAAVITGERTVKKGDLDKLLAVLGTPSFVPSRMPEVGAQLSNLLLADEVLAVLPAFAANPLVVVHDGPASRIPWELLQIGGRFPVLEAGITRRYLADNLSVAKWLEARRQSPQLRLLLVVNPNRGEYLSLPGAEEEGERVKALFKGELGVDITERSGADATRAALLQDFRSGKYDVVHYAGHAAFDPANPGGSGLLCHGGEILGGSDLAGLGNLPNLVVFNACESGRVRGGKGREAVTQQAERATGLAEAFLRGGVANYVGTYWPVGDGPAVTFATTFYPALLRGQSVGEALRAARRTVQENEKTIDWADYIHYGNQDFVLKTGESR